MSTGFFLIIVVLCVGGFLVTGILLGIVGNSSRSHMRSNMRTIVDSQRQAGAARLRPDGARKTVLDTAEESQVQKISDSKLTLLKRLKYARWKFPPSIFRMIQVGLSLFLASVSFGLGLNILMITLFFFFGWLFMGWFLNAAVDRRFNAFDADYPAFLQSFVGLLKTGMNPLTGLAAAVEGLEDGSLVRSEIELMLERLRMGVQEEKSIGAFGEDIYHPEIELFVQALLLSQRVGGNLSSTLDRLSSQVRKRQFFRKSADAAVGMQRGSIWTLIAILVAIQVLLFFQAPEIVRGAWEDDTGFQVWQVAIGIICLGVYWVRQITKIRV